MSNFIQHAGPLAPFAILPVAWLFVVHMLAEKAGWYRLAKKYPNRDEEAALKLRFQSGWLGGVSMSSILRVEACPSGLRVGIWKLFGPFSHDFFVPWNEISVERTKRNFWKVAVLSLGNGDDDLTLFDFVANRLARSVPNHWPEQGEFRPDTDFVALRIAFTHWFVGMAFIIGFFTLAPALMSGKLGIVPPVIPEMFGAMLGLFALREFLLRTRE
jgi:hypothetical protein